MTINRQQSFLRHAPLRLSLYTLLSASVLMQGSLLYAEEFKAEDVGFYEYWDDAGNRFMGQQVPPENLKHGYNVLDKRGQLLTKIPRQPTPEELLQFKREKIKEEKRQQALIEQQKKNELLLKKFSTINDVEKARDRKIAALNVVIDITRGNISRLQTDYEDIEAKAALLERRGETLPRQIFSDLENIKAHISDAQETIKAKQSEKKKVQQEYASDVARLNQLRPETKK